MGLGLLLGLAVALFWGSADALASTAARTIGTLRATTLAQAAGLLCLLLVLLVFIVCRPGGTLTSGLLPALALGALTSVFACIGYYTFYYALSIGPVAIVSPISSTSAALTALLALLILHNPMSTVQMGFIGLIFLGVLIAATNLQDIRQALSSKGLFNKGVKWALIATVAFACMDFCIGVSAQTVGWLLPVVFTRLFCCGLFLPLALVQQARLKKNVPEQKDAGQAQKKLLKGVLLALGAGALENVGTLAFSFDAQATSTAIVAILASNYSTVALLIGLVAFRERLGRSQIIGIMLILVGVGLLS